MGTWKEYQERDRLAKIRLESTPPKRWREQAPLPAAKLEYLRQWRERAKQRKLACAREYGLED